MVQSHHTIVLSPSLGPACTSQVLHPAACSKSVCYKHSTGAPHPDANARCAMHARPWMRRAKRHAANHTHSRPRPGVHAMPWQAQASRGSSLYLCADLLRLLPLCHANCSSYHCATLAATSVPRLLRLSHLCHAYCACCGCAKLAAAATSKPHLLRLPQVLFVCFGASGALRLWGVTSGASGDMYRPALDFLQVRALGAPVQVLMLTLQVRAPRWP